jgi:hypothetical protein
MAVYVVPTAAGHCRMITRFIKSKKNFTAGGGRSGFMRLFLAVRACGLRCERSPRVAACARALSGSSAASCKPCCCVALWTPASAAACPGVLCDNP